MTHIVDLIPFEHLEAGLRNGSFASKEEFYAEVRRLLGRESTKVESDMIRNSMFPEERNILLDLPFKKPTVNFDPSLVEDRLGKPCSKGIHMMEKPEDFYYQKRNFLCKRCELARTNERKRLARARRAAERAKNPPKPRVRKPRPKKTPKVRTELNVQQVLAIRAEYANDGQAWGWTSRTAKKYDVGESTVRAIVTRRTWKDV